MDYLNNTSEKNSENFMHIVIPLNENVFVKSNVEC